MTQTPLNLDLNPRFILTFLTFTCLMWLILLPLSNKYSTPFTHLLLLFQLDFSWTLWFSLFLRPPSPPLIDIPRYPHAYSGQVSVVSLAGDCCSLILDGVMWLFLRLCLPLLILSRFVFFLLHQLFTQLCMYMCAFSLLCFFFADLSDKNVICHYL